MAKGIKTGGRKAGTPNKLTFDTRQVLVNVLADELEQLPELLEKLAPEQRIDAICKLAKFALPPMMGVSSSVVVRQEAPKTGMFEIPDI